MDTKNLSCVRNDNKTWLLTFKDENGTAVDITGWTVFFTCKNSREDVDADALISYDITSHTDPTNGQTKIELTTTDTARLGSYPYDIQIKKTDGKITTVVTGDLSFVEDVTIRTS